MRQERSGRVKPSLMTSLRGRDEMHWYRRVDGHSSGGTQAQSRPCLPIVGHDTNFDKVDQKDDSG